ncbi:4-hydroxy-tetrahydrodipicolinate reductase [Flavobacteriaceae bacterium]|nr:4-hydroxy-tetrahydrodipicolinate reductase [Flavobacteriaceae bacterium]MDB4067617.1 4-hydroxy-tetrahydrodipicolinate reductase [Flavobacteriaceae bacterium]MDB4152963.1 4-hydroxy-tetrahydrodipicolinate reductase [Flavobacteriaceae bacterium]|tara:strand:- start:9134 stop:9838 length:705 start_codon:yes stop_codon:yes gene_type:complete
MKIALLGYGRMGKAIEQIANERGHTIVAKIDKNENQGKLSEAEVAINFSIPDAAVANIKAAMEKQIPVVCGTTGWLEQLKEVEDFCLQNKTAFLYASNFSVGVNLFFKLNEVLAKLMHPHKNYSAAMKEIHHIHKLDAPSGTAITLAEGIFDQSKYTDWSIDDTKGDITLPIAVERTGEVPGTHSIEYKSSVDSISIQHEAHSRQGFALGAVIAAEWIQDKKGVFTMNDVLDIK